jgi:ATP-dependent RNA helicase DDX23/PRP28
MMSKDTRTGQYSFSCFVGHVLINRIGRTGRAGKLGTAITFLSESDSHTFFELKNLIENSPLSKMNPELARHDDAKQKVTKEMKRKRDDHE